MALRSSRWLLRKEPIGRLRLAPLGFVFLVPLSDPAPIRLPPIPERTSEEQPIPKPLEGPHRARRALALADAALAAHLDLQNGFLAAAVLDDPHSRNSAVRPRRGGARYSP